jgi:hypothetical protein
MLRVTGRTVALATVFAALAAGQASAAITETAVTSPGPGPLFYNPDTNGPGTPLEVSGTTNSTDPAVDQVDIKCAYDNGAEDSGSTLAGGVPVENDGSFSAQIDLNLLSYYICRLIAVPAGEGTPYPLANRAGPVVGVGGFSRVEISGGPNDGKLYDFYQASSALQGYWSVRSAGDCYVNDSYVMDPVTLGYDEDWLYDCAQLRQNQPLPAGKELRIDDRTALLPSKQLNVAPAPPIAQAANIPGLQAIAAFGSSIEDGTGNMIVSSTEPTSFCDPVPTACEQFIDTGVRLDARTTGGTSSSPGRTLTVEHDWVNTTGQPKALHAAYDVRINGSPDWRFPGDLAYAPRAGGSTVEPMGDGPGSFYFRADDGVTCSAVEPCGSVTWAAPPDEIFFTSTQSVLLSYDRTIPPGCTARIAFTHSQGRVQSSVDIYASGAEAALATQPSITCPPPGPSTGGSSAVPPPETPAAKKKCKKAKKKKKGKKRKRCKKKR